MTGAVSPSRLILPGLTSEEENSKRLAMQLLQTIERENFTNREILGACAVLAACTIKARYSLPEWDHTFKSFVVMTRDILEQF